MSLKKEQIAGGNYPYLRHPFSYFVASMQRLGIHFIEFYAASPHLYVWDYTPAQVYAHRRMLEQAQIKVVCFTAEQCLYPISVATEDPLVRERSLRYYERALEQAAVLESPNMQMISGGGLIGSDPAENWKRSADGIYRLTRRAEQLGVTILLEADRTCTVTNTPQQLQMISEIGSPRLSGMIDTNAVYHAKEDFAECVRLLGDNLRHLHFIDINQQAGCLVPGTGILPMADYLKILGQSGYQGYLVPELWGTRYQDCAEEAMAQGLAFCQNAL